MNVKDILQFVDNLVFTETNKHLDDLQTKIIEEVSKGKTYRQIADMYDYDEGYIGDETRKLFKILSQSLGEDINKSNFCWTIERVTNSNRIINFENNHINWCSNHSQTNESPEKKHQVNPMQSASRCQHDLTLAPKLTELYGRERELQLLYDWTLNDPIPLIAILGLKGIGKTSLVRKFVDINLNNFDFIIWKNLKVHQPSIHQLLREIIIQYSNFSEKSLIYQFSEFLQQKKCLLIFDDVQTIFTSGELVGKYQHQYQDYQDFFQMFTELAHQSHLILISQEQPPEINFITQCIPPELGAWEQSLIDRGNRHNQGLKLSGLYHRKILQNMGLKSDCEHEYLQLMKLYNGNILYLTDVANLITNLFAGDISNFLAENTLVITNEINTYLTELFNRLSPIERQIVRVIAQSPEVLSIDKLHTSLQFYPGELMNALQSLCQRYLIHKTAPKEVHFSLDPVFLTHLNHL